MRPPISVLIIAILALVSGILSLITIPFLFSGESISQMGIEGHAAFPMAVSLAGSLCNAAAGFAMLLRKNWGRWLLLYSYLISMILNIFIYGSLSAVALGLPFVVVYWYFLTRQRAADYFKFSPAEYNRQYPVYYIPDEPATGRRLAGRIFSVLLSVLGGYLLLMTIVILVFGLSLADSGRIAMVVAIFLTMTAICILAGIALWNLKRWRMPLGSVLLTSGICSAFLIAALLVFRSGGYSALDYPELSFALNPYSLLAGSVSAGILLIAGSILFIDQQRKDKENYERSTRNQP